MSEPPSSTGPDDAFERAPLWMHHAAIGISFALLMIHSWGTWPDLLIDFGRELYTPWRISEGSILYRDIAWFNGPLSQSWNALAFRLFGVGLNTLVGVNAVLLAMLLALLHRTLRAFASRSAATCACLLVLVVSGFGQLTDVGNYNFITPYSHEITHGVLLGVGSLALLSQGRLAGRHALAAGVLVGLAFLTKPESFVAALGGSGIALALGAGSGRQAAHLGAFLAGSSAAVAIGFALLAWKLTPGEALIGVLGGWPHVWRGEAIASPFYRTGMGLDVPGQRIAEMCASAVAVSALLLPGALISRSRVIGLRASGLAFFATVLVVTLLLLGGAPLLAAARVLPLFTLVVAVLSFRRAVETRGARDVAAAAFAVFSVASLAKLGLNARVVHYGFALALPAVALAAVALVDWLPRKAATRGWHASPLRACAVALLLMFGAVCWLQSAYSWSFKTEVVGSGRDAFRADSRAAVLNDALAWLAARRGERPTLVVLPEGILVNYLARLENPTPFLNFVPVDVTLFGERNIEAALRRNPPDLVMLVHRETTEYGAPFFGVDYAKRLHGWVTGGYRVVRVFGDPPLRPQSNFGIAVLERVR